MKGAEMPSLPAAIQWVGPVAWRGDEPLRALFRAWQDELVAAGELPEASYSSVRIDVDTARIWDGLGHVIVVDLERRELVSSTTVRV